MISEIDLVDSASLPEGGLQTFAAPNDGPKVLLTRQQGQVHAFAPNCPHYGAPLEKGKVVAGRLVCPWHHACFRVENGHLCEPPALDDLPAYEVREANGRILVQVPPSPTASTDKPEATPTAEVGGTPPAPADAKPADTHTFVIVGGGAAGEYAAQTLRQEGFTGRLVLISADGAAPYDRTKLSKAYLAGKAKPEGLPLRQQAFYEAQKIDFIGGAEATGLDLNKQEISLKGRPAVHYDQLLLALGATPNRLPKLPGHDLQNVLPLRTQQDADALLAAAKEAKQVVVIGSSFIGMEAASSLVEGRAVTVVAQEKVPFEKVLGPEVGAMFQKLHEEKGVKFEAEAEVAELLGDDGKASGVKLKSGQILPADLVVLGVGVRPATDWLQDALPLEKDGGLKTDQYLQVAKNVYAAGDIATFPLALAGGQATRIEHWRLAQQHGRTAARNMLGKQEAYTAAPFFWTQQYGKSLRYAGHATKPDETRILGDLAKQEFLALYIEQGRITAVAGMGRDADMIYIAELLNNNQMPAPAEVSDATSWAELAG
ncbi:FAD-dependent oxidoreductase [Hymenobacter sp. RP-2-7]|uniref:FAD-dependent oxidoreductase n=1 Tax=Hymenobacter polaris TaxID=2682546 RepID=A0A7Y0FNT5_9BACT|nr:FAD-dependent oxidoreductase [Hymenobacter polaris]NML66855.1 FAD-dependent oxidoreductase [Hymenobacter polaris]